MSHLNYCTRSAVLLSASLLPFIRMLWRELIKFMCYSAYSIELLLLTVSLPYRFALKYFNSNPAPFHYYNVADTEDGPKAKKRKVHYSAGLEPISAQDIALCCYSFLKLKTDHFRVLWDWSLLLKEFLSHSEPYIRWWVMLCFITLLEFNSKYCYLHWSACFQDIMSMLCPAIQYEM